MNIIEVLDYVNTKSITDSNNVSADLDVTKHDARVRLGKLNKSGLIRIVEKKYPYQYEITEFGKRHLAYSKTEAYKTKQWNALIHKKDRPPLTAKIFKNSSKYIVKLYDTDDRLCASLNVDNIIGDIK